MIRGIRRPEDLASLGVGRRLAVRVGALLRRRVEVTPAVLEMAKPGTSHEALLLDPLLLEKAEALDEAAVLALARRHLAANPHDAEALTVHAADEGARVLCLREEVEAGEAWAGEPEDGARSSTGQSRAPDGLLAVLGEGNAPLARRAPEANDPSVQRQGQTLSTRAELDHLRLRLAASASRDERTEALRILVHAAALTVHEKAECIFRGLEDKDLVVRAEAAGLLRALAVPDDFAEALGALGQGDAEARLHAAERLRRRLAPLSQTGLPAGRPADQTPLALRQLEAGAAALVILAQLRDETSAAVAPRLLDLLAETAPALAAHPERLAGILRVSLCRLETACRSGGLASSSAAVVSSAQRLCRALVRASPEAVYPLLKAERERCSVRAVEAFLLQALLEAAERGTEAEAEAALACAVFLARDTEESTDSRLAGSALSSHGAAALEAMVKTFPKATGAGKKYLLQLMDDLARFQQIPVQTRNRAAELVLSALNSSHRTVRMAAAGCRFVAADDVAEDLRARVAESLLTALPDFGFKTELDSAEDTVALLGLPAMPALLKRLPAESPPDVRVQAVRILGHLTLELRPPAGRMAAVREAVTEVIRRLQALTLETAFPDRRVLLTALGQVVASPAASKEAAEVVARHLLQHAARGQRGIVEALEGLTWVAAARRARTDVMESAVALLKQTIALADVEPSVKKNLVRNEVVLEFGGENEQADVVPVALRGLSRLAVSSSCPSSIARDLVEVALSYWKRIVAGELTWGPVNSLQLVQALQDVASHPAVPDELRIEVLRGLARRLSHPPVLRAAGNILGVCDTPATCAVALTLGLAITGLRRADGRYEPEDRAVILKALGQIAARRQLGPPDAAGQEKAQRFRLTALEELLQGAQDLVGGSYEALCALRDARLLPAQEQARLESRLTDMRALARS